MREEGLGARGGGKKRGGEGERMGRIGARKSKEAEKGRGGGGGGYGGEW